jgi:hypothetical protein
MTHLRNASMILALVASIGGCAAGRQAARPTSARIPTSAPERLAGLREANPQTKAAEAEQRFSAEEDKQRREDARAAKAARQTQVDVVENKKKTVKK